MNKSDAFFFVWLWVFVCVCLSTIYVIFHICNACHYITRNYRLIQPPQRFILRNKSHAIWLFLHKNPFIFPFVFASTRTSLCYTSHDKCTRKKKKTLQRRREKMNQQQHWKNTQNKSFVTEIRKENTFIRIFAVTTAYFRRRQKERNRKRRRRKRRKKSDTKTEVVEL